MGNCLDPALLWLWSRPVAAALIGSLAWEPPCAAGVALEKLKKKKKFCIGMENNGGQNLIST